MLPELVVTDFAGTTMADEGAVLGAYRQALGQYEIPFTEAELAARRGANKLAVFRELAARVHSGASAEALAETALACFESALRHEYESGEVREVPGAEATVQRLKQAGIRVALGSRCVCGVAPSVSRPWAPLSTPITQPARALLPACRSSGVSPTTATRATSTTPRSIMGR